MIIEPQEELGQKPPHLVNTFLLDNRLIYLKNERHSRNLISDYLSKL